MNLNKKPLLLAVAVGMGLVPLTGVFAAPLNDQSSTTPSSPISIPAEAKESASEYFSMYNSATTSPTVAPTTIAVGGDMDVYIYTMPGYAVRIGEQKTLRVKISLTGGVKFNKVPTLLCVHSAATVQNALSTKGISAALWADVAVAATDVTGSFAAGGAGTTALKLTPTDGQGYYSFAFPEGFNVAAASSGACLLTFTAAEPYGGVALTTTGISVFKGAVAGSDVTMNVETTYDDFFGKVTKTAAIKIISFVTAYKAEFTKANIMSRN